MRLYQVVSFKDDGSKDFYEAYETRQEAEDTIKFYESLFIDSFTYDVVVFE